MGTLFLQRFLGFKEVRDMMAHGAMSAVPQWGLTFEYISRERGGLIAKKSRRFSEDQLLQLAEAVNRLSRLAQGLYWRAGLHSELPEPRWGDKPAGP